MASSEGKVNLKKRHYQMRKSLTEEKKKEILKEIFLKRVGYELNLDNPKTYNEKVMWLKLNYQDKRITQCADKYAVKEYIAKKIGAEYVVPNIASWNNPDEINFDELPDQFVLKVNWSSGYNIICKDKSTLDRERTLELLRYWMKPDRNAYYQMFNWGYKNMKPVVYAEQYIEQSNGQVYDYKFGTSFGKVKTMLIVTNRSTEEQMTYDFFDRDYNHLPIKCGTAENAESLPQDIEKFKKMAKLAEKLAKPFPFVRVDFYDVEGKLYVGEMTFYPGGGVLPFVPQEWDLKMGEWFDLPRRKMMDGPIVLGRLRRMIVSHDVVKGKHYIVLFKKIRIPFGIKR